MRLIAVSRATGRELARELPASGNIPLVQAGATLTAPICDALIAQGIHAVYVHDELSAGIEPRELLPEHVRQEAASAMRRAVAAAAEAVQRKQPLPEEVVKDLASVVMKMCQVLEGEPDAALAIVDLADAHERVHTHSVNVCALSLLLGQTLFRRHGWIDWDGRRRRDRIDERLLRLGLGTLLHDIGKVAIPEEIVNKGDHLTHGEREIVRQHPRIGAELLRSHSVSLVVKAIVRDHHERWDGSGYPRGVDRDRINPLARIATVADLYDNLTAPVAGGPGRTTPEAVAEVEAAAGTIADPEVVAIFRRIVFPYPVGTEVEVDRGLIGVVCKIDPAEPDIPIVRFQGPTGPLELPIDLRARSVRAAA